MRRAALLLLLLATAATSDVINTTTVLSNDTILLGEHAVFIANDTIIDGNKTIVIANDTIIETDGDHAPIVRKKRTFGDIVFRGLADVLGYDVQRKPAQAAFPPPLAPVPGIDTPLQDGPAPPPPCGAPRAAPPPPCGAPKPAPPPPCGAPKPAPPPPCGAPKPAPPPPCGAPRAAPPPCMPPKPKPPPPPPPCPKPRAAPKPRPPPPPPPPPPPCPKPRGNPCGAKDETGELITSNLQLSFNINRNRPTQAPAAESVEEFAPIAIEPRAARLPARQERKPHVFVDAFVVRDGVKQKVNTADADVFNAQQAELDDDYIEYDDEAPQEDRQIVEDDYEDAQESRDKTQSQFGRVVNQFWEKNKNRKNPNKLPKNHYKNVHFGDRDLASIQRRSDSSKSHQSLQREGPKSNRVPLPFSRDTDEEYEETTTTEDPHRQLRPRVLPPTEHNPNQIDTVTVRVPPIYKEKRPKKLHRGPDREEEDNEEASYYYNNSNEDDSDSDGENSAVSLQTEPTRKKRRKKSRRRTRSTKEQNPESEEKEELKKYDPFSELGYDYYGKKLPISDEEKSYSRYEIPEPTKDPDLARIEEKPFLDDHERLVEDPERFGEDERLDDSDRTEDSGHSDESGRTDDSKRTHDKERLVEDKERFYDDNERTDERHRADSSEKTDELSPQAKIRETGYRNNYLEKTNIRVEDPRPLPHRKPKKKKA